MAITKKPYSVQPAYNEITFEDNANTSLVVGGIEPSPTDALTYYSVMQNGKARFDIKRFVQSLFYDNTMQITSWAKHDYNLKARYYADNNIYLALNAVKQIGESLDLLEDGKQIFLTDRVKVGTSRMSIPYYDGYPTGVTVMYKDDYELDLSKSHTVTIQVTANQTVRFPFLSYDGYIVYGDGAIEKSQGGAGQYKSHTYTAAGTYTVNFLPIASGTVVIPTSGTYATYFTVYQSVLRTVENGGDNITSMSLYNCTQLTSVQGNIGRALLSMNNIFRGCSKLTSIAENFFLEVGIMGNITTAQYAFYGTGFITLPDQILAPLSNLTDIQYMFATSKIEILPMSLLWNQTKVINANRCFYQCSSLIDIPDDLFRYMGSGASATTINVDEIFRECTSITSIPVNLFRYIGTKVTKLPYLFYGCAKLVTIPSDIFRYNTAVTQVDYAFAYCSSLTVIPAGIFRYNVNITTLYGTFYQSAITAIPVDIFRYTTKLSICQSVFGFTKIQTIPTGLFAYCKASLTDVSSLFYSSTLTEIPSDLLTNAIKLTDASGLFYGTKITTIPPPFIAGCTSLTNISSMFAECTELTLIQMGLFQNLSNVTTITRLFYNCPSVTGYPSEMFRSMPRATSLYEVFGGTVSAIYFNKFPSDMFQDCGHITDITRLFYQYGSASSNPNQFSIASSFFSGLVNVTNASYVFGQCPIANIPASLFSTMTKLTNVSYAFSMTAAQTKVLTSIPNNLFDNNKLVTNFTQTFAEQRLLTGPSPTGSDGIALYNRAGKPGYPTSITGTACFRNATGLSDYTSIPSTWK